MSPESFRFPHSAFALCSIVLLLFGCEKDFGVDGKQPNASTQVAIPWPGLANSAWPMYGHDPQHTGRSPFRGPQQGKVEWFFDAGFLVYSSPSIDLDGTVYFCSLRGKIFAISSGGSILWNTSQGGGESSLLISTDGSLYACGGDSLGIYSYLYCLDKSGSRKWLLPLVRNRSLFSPTISKDGETIYLLCDTVFAVRTTGVLGWKIALPDSAHAGYSPSISPDGATLYVPASKGLYAVDTSGGIRWKYSLPVTPSDPAVDNQGNIYFAMGSNLYAVTSSGAALWIAALVVGGGVAGPSIGGDGTIYATGRSLYAVDPTGKVKWSFNLSLDSHSTPAIDNEGTIYFGCNTTRTAADSINFIALNSDGSVKFKLCLRSPDGSVPDIDSHPSISSDGSIYVGSDYPHGFQVFKIR